MTVNGLLHLCDIDVKKVGDCHISQLKITATPHGLN